MINSMPFKILRFQDNKVIKCCILRSGFAIMIFAIHFY